MKKPPTSSSSGLNTNRPYVKVLRQFQYGTSHCRLCKKYSVLTWWVTKDAEVSVETMRLDWMTRANCDRVCEDCMRASSLLW